MQAKTRKNNKLATGRINLSFHIYIRNCSFWDIQLYLFLFVQQLLSNVLGKELVIIAGPNGSGKTTFANNYLLSYKAEFLNADYILEQKWFVV